ncbi:MAG: L-2-amino-thiazoline-4-carboxylic acid hydrolase [Andreesenia angusta]|nr:L-2-amino-thiazoline-4-carboxylic acid hydrolase [Andreesenia angusta]
MKLSKFYKSKIGKEYVQNIDRRYRENFENMIDSIEGDNWTKKQKKKQKSSIIPILALYKTFIDFGFSKEDAKELSRLWIYNTSEKAHKILYKTFNFPKFEKIFRFIFRKGLEADEIWISKTIESDDEALKVDITKCLWKDTCDYFNCPELCEVFCSADWVVFGDIDRLEFNRSETLGTKGDKCDFRFRFK